MYKVSTAKESKHYHLSVSVIKCQGGQKKKKKKNGLYPKRVRIQINLLTEADSKFEFNGPQSQYTITF